MRVLDPEVARERKNSLLHWVIHHYIRTSKPISSQLIAAEAGLKLSSATIRNILGDLEREGFLFQSHASAGRVPTDKGYRFYVDYLMHVQRLASEEKEHIQRGYQRRVEELDQILSETSRMLSRLSHSAGFVLSPKLDAHEIKRLELVPLEGRRCLLLLVSNSGMIRHWPIELSGEASPARLSVLNRFLNDLVVGRSLDDLQAELLRRVEAAEREFKEVGLLARGILSQVTSWAKPEELFVEGASNILGVGEDADLSQLRGMVQVLEEKKRFAELLRRQFAEPGKGLEAPKNAKVRVRIGRENQLPELNGLSVIATTYELQDRMVGMLGIVGPKRMEYSKMVALVDFVSGLMSRSLERWDGLWSGEHE